MTNGTRRRWGVSVTPRPLFTPGKDPVPIVQGAGWAPEPVWTGTENLAPTGIRFPDRPACSQLLYRLRYPAHISSLRVHKNGRHLEIRLWMLVLHTVRIYVIGWGSASLSTSIPLSELSLRITELIFAKAKN